MSDDSRQLETSATGFFPNDLKKKRDEYTQDLRKGKRGELLNDYRHRNLQNEQEMTDQEALEEDRKRENQLLGDLRNELRRQIFMTEDFDGLIENINSRDRTMQLYGLIGIGHLFQNSEIIQERIESNCVSRILRVVAEDGYYVLQREGISVIKRVCCRRADLINALLQSDGIPILFKLLKSDCKEIVFYTAMAISAIASNSTSNRDIILQEGGLSLILETVLQSSDLYLLKEGLRTVLPLCSRKPWPPQKLVEPAIPVLCSLYLAHQDEEVMALAAQSLSWIADTAHAAEQIIKLGVVSKLISYMDHHNIVLSRDCFGVIWKLFMFVQRSTLIDTYTPQVVPKVFKLTQSPNMHLKWGACLFISTFTKRSSRTAQIIMENPYYVDMLVKLATSSDQNVAKSACQALSNAIKNIDKDRFEEVLELGILDCFIYHLQKSDSQIVLEHVLEGVWNVMNRAATILAENYHNTSMDGVLNLLDDKKTIQHIKNLQSRQTLNENCKNRIFSIHSLYSQICRR